MSNFFYDYMTEAEREAEMERVQDEHDLKRIQYALEAVEMAHQVRLSDIETKAICENYTDDELELAYSRELAIYTEGVGDLINKLIQKFKNIWYSITGQTDKIIGAKVTSNEKIEVATEPGGFVKFMEDVANTLKNWFGWYKTDSNGKKQPNWLGITLTTAATVGTGGMLASKIAKHNQMLNEIRAGKKVYIQAKDAPRWAQALNDAGKKIADQIEKFKAIKDDENTGHLKSVLISLATGVMTVGKGMCNALSNGVAAVTGSVFDDFGDDVDGNAEKNNSDGKKDSSEDKGDNGQSSEKAEKQKKEAEKYRKNKLTEDEQKLLNSKQAQTTRTDFVHLINVHSYGPGCKVKDADNKHFIDITKYKRGNKIKIGGRQYSELFALFKRNRKVINNEYTSKFSIYEKIVPIFAKLDSSTTAAAPTAAPIKNAQPADTDAPKDNSVPVSDAKSADTEDAPKDNSVPDKKGSKVKPTKYKGDSDNGDKPTKSTNRVSPRRVEKKSGSGSTNTEPEDTNTEPQTTTSSNNTEPEDTNTEPQTTTSSNNTDNSTPKPTGRPTNNQGGKKSTGNAGRSNRKKTGPLTASELRTAAKGVVGDAKKGAKRIFKGARKLLGFGESSMWTEAVLSDDGEIESISMYIESYSEDGSKVTTITEYAMDDYDEDLETIYEGYDDYYEGYDDYDDNDIESIYESYEDQLTSLNDLIDLL